MFAAKQATSVIPIVFATANDPIGSGFVASLARPGGNITGLSLQNTDSASKRLELLREVVVGLRRLAILTNVSYGAAVAELREAHATARASGLEVITLEIQRSEDIAPAFEALNGPIGALYVCSDPLTTHQPDSHQHVGAVRPTADDIRLSGVCRSGRFDVLWTKLPRPVPALCQLCRQDSAWDQAGRHPGRTADQIRFRHQSLKTAKALGLEMKA